MKSDLFYMSMAILSVWREEDYADYFACTVVESDEIDYKTVLLQKSDHTFNSLFHIFSGTMNFEDASVYMTKPPCEDFLKACIAKSISKIYYLTDQENIIDTKDKPELIPFPYTFGRIIDALSKYKPVVSTLNTI